MDHSHFPPLITSRPVPAPRRSPMTNSHEQPTTPPRPPKSTKLKTETTESPPPVPRRVSSIQDDTDSKTLLDLREFSLSKGFTDDEFQRAITKLDSGFDRNRLFSQLIHERSSVDNTPELPARIRTRKPQTQNRLTSKYVVKADRVPESDLNHASNLRPIVIDGSNVAFSHGHGTVFSCKGIDLVVQYFKSRGHADIYVVTPIFYLNHHTNKPIRDQYLLHKLQSEQILITTPCIDTEDHRRTAYDDRSILDLAVKHDAIVISNDSYRELAKYSEDYRRIITKQLLTFTFLDEDDFRPTSDPLGKGSMPLEEFLRKKRRAPPNLCKYGLNCTYGDKCKYAHPERSGRSNYSDNNKLYSFSDQALTSLRSMSSGPSSLPEVRISDRVSNNASEDYILVGRGPASLPSNQTTSLHGTPSLENHQRNGYQNFQETRRQVNSINEAAVANADFINGRERIFNNLSELFDRQKVIDVMKQFPNETDPKVITIHVINS